MLEFVFSMWFLCVIVVGTVIALICLESPFIMSVLLIITIYLSGTAFDINYLTMIGIGVGYIVLGVLYSYYYWNKRCREAVEEWNNSDKDDWAKGHLKSATHFGSNINKVSSVIFSWGVDIFIDLAKSLHNLVKELLRTVLRKSFENISNKHLKNKEN